mgnify:CR=1 FL=1
MFSFVLPPSFNVSEKFGVKHLEKKNKWLNSQPGWIAIKQTFCYWQYVYMKVNVSQTFFLRMKGEKAY